MAKDRIGYSIKNAQTSVGFFILMIIVNFFSRRIFLDMLGDELCGLTTLMNYTIGLLNVADLGIATAVSCALYRPLAEGNRDQINTIVSILGYLFRIVGTFILVAGLVVSLYIADIAGDTVSSGAIYAAYFTYLITSSLTYLVNYKQFLLIASQKAYIVTSAQNITSITKLFLQMGALWLLPVNYYIFLALELLFAIIYAVMIERRTTREYPWLSCSIGLGRRSLKEYGYIFKSIKQIVSHKFAGVILLQTDSIIISKLISLSSVTLFQNYYMLATRVVSLATAIFAGFPAAIGNLVAEDNSAKSLSVFKQYNALCHLVGGIFAFSVYHLSPAFITLWLGSEHYLLSRTIVALITAGMYISIIKMPLYSFLNGYGIYRDTWAPWCEALINLVISIWGAKLWGLAGVAAGTAISTGLITYLWKPFLLMRSGIGSRVREYYGPTLKYTIIYGALFALFSYLIDATGGVPNSRFLPFLGYSALVVLLFSALYTAALLLTCSHTKALLSTIAARFIKRFRK